MVEPVLLMTDASPFGKAEFYLCQRSGAQQSNTCWHNTASVLEFFCIGTALENHGHGCGGPTRTQPANGTASFIKAMNARNFYARLLSPLHTLSSSVLPVRDVRAVAVLPGFSTGL